MPRIRCPDAAGSRRRFAGRARPLLCRELLAGQIREQGGEGAVENGLVVAGGQRVPQHVLGEPQLLQCRAADRQLVPVAIGRERRDLGRARRVGQGDGESRRQRTCRRGGRRLRHRSDLGRRVQGQDTQRRRLRFRQLPDGRRNIPAGREPRHDLLDLGLPLPADRLEDTHVVLACQVGTEHSHGGEVDLGGGEEVEDDREALGRACGLDAVEGLVLGEREDVAAIGEERRVARAQVHVAGVELGETRLPCRLQHRSLLVQHGSLLA